MDQHRPSGEIDPENCDMGRWAGACRVIAVHLGHRDQRVRPKAGMRARKRLDALDMPEL